MTAEVINFSGITLLDFPVERIYKGAMKAKLKTLVVVGVDEDGDFYFASTKADGGEVLWYLELAKKRLLEVEV